MQQKIKAWYFSHTKKLGYDDNRRIVAGRTHSIRFPVKHHYYRFPIEAPICCCVGLHGSIKPLHALEYKKYDISRIYVWRVELSGMMDFNYDKIAAEKRKYLWGYNATDIIKRFLMFVIMTVL